jgi:hypothetical protein
MNPPFHLVKEGKYDYDFVQRAFSMLKPGGKLVAITGIKYKDFPEAVKWYKDKKAVIRVQNVEWREKEPGESLKNLGMEINNVKIAFIKLVKDELEEKDKNWSVKEDIKLQEIEPDIPKPDTVKEVLREMENKAVNQINLIEELARPVELKIAKGEVTKDKGMQSIIDEINKMDINIDKLTDKKVARQAKLEAKKAEKRIALAQFDKPKLAKEEKRLEKRLNEIDTSKEDAELKDLQVALKFRRLPETMEDIQNIQAKIRAKLIKAYSNKIYDENSDFEVLPYADQNRMLKVMQKEELESIDKQLKGGSFWSDFKKGFKQGFMGTLDVAKTVLPFVV